LENLEKIKKSNEVAPLPVVNKNAVGSSVCRSKVSSLWYHYCEKNNHNTADCRAIAKTKQQKKVRFEAKSVPKRQSLAFLFEETNALKRQWKPEKFIMNKKRKVESLLSTEINLTTSNDEDEEYFVTFPNIFSCITKPGTNTSVTAELEVSHKANHEENVLSALADTDFSSSIILGTFVSKDHIINAESSQPIGVQCVDTSPLTKNISNIFTSRIQSKKTNFLDISSG
jgi:hypothetical protein